MKDEKFDSSDGDHMADASIHVDRGGERPLRPALVRGWKRSCPNCGGGALFDGYLTVRDECDICGETFSHHRADDAPSWLTMIVVGHLIAPVMLTVYQTYDLPVWAHAVIWPLLAIAGILILLPRLKGGIIAFQWAHRMHGFDNLSPQSGRTYTQEDWPS